MTNKENEEIRAQIAKLLVGRCNNCYNWINSEKRKFSYIPNSNWINPNFGPFCNECMELSKKRDKE